MRVVIKIGSSSLAHAGGRLNIRKTEELCKIISDLKNSGLDVIIVSSGAIAMGTGKIGLKERPHDMPTKQAAAAVGQCELMYTYDKLFSEYNHTVAQILITAADIKHEDRHENFCNTLERLIELGIIPIINENDTISTEEIVIGDNDTLAAFVATSAKADLLVLVSDVDGLYTSDPRKNTDSKLISDIYEIDDKILSLAGDSSTGLGTGGMRTKLNAARTCMQAGCDMVIANSKDPSILYGIMDGTQMGTRFHAVKSSKPDTPSDCRDEGGLR